MFVFFFARLKILQNIFYSYKAPYFRFNLNRIEKPSPLLIKFPNSRINAVIKQYWMFCCIKIEQYIVTFNILLPYIYSIAGTRKQIQLFFFFVQQLNFLVCQHFSGNLESRKPNNRR